MNHSNKNFKIIVHVIAGAIALVFLITDLFYHNLNVWRKSETLLAISVFYVHSLLILPWLFKNKKAIKYIGFTFVLFAVEAVLSSIFTIASRPDYVYIFKRILNNGPAFGVNLERLYNARFSNAISLFGISFIYGILVIDKKNKSKSLISLIFDKGASELALHIYILIILSITFYFSNILFSNVVLGSFILFYSHLLLASPILFKKKRLVNFLLITLSEIFLFTVILTHFTNTTTVFIISIGISVISISSVYAIVKHQVKTNEIALSRNATELNQLKSQINPHFLFNALNTLYGFAIKEDAENTATSIKKFSNLIRFSLSDIESDFIPLSKEIKYIKDYVDIQLARYPVKQNIQLSFNNFENYSIAPMLLIPFVENSFKHGINPTEESTLNVNLACKSGTIFFECINSLKKQNKSNFENEGFGIGIENVKSRLALIYPDNYKLNIIEEKNLFKVKLEINDKSYSD